MNMKNSKFIPVSLFIVFAFNSLRLMAQEDIGNEYRITLFPSHKVTDKIGGFGYLGYVWNPEKNYQTYYLGWPCATYTPKTWMQFWGGLIGAYTNNEDKSDQLELRPFAGAKFFLPNNLKWNIYNFTRYEYRALQDRETKDWNNYGRLRVRFGVEIPFTKKEKAFQPRSLYGLADIEPYFRFDKNWVDPMRIRAGIGYVMKAVPIRIEFIYHAQFTQPDKESGLGYSDNIYRVNIKLGMHKGILGSLYNPDLDD
jgi:hypothetical protein